jgi:hypothetical protein
MTCKERQTVLFRGNGVEFQGLAEGLQKPLATFEGGKKKK